MSCVAEDFVNEHTSARGHSRYGRTAYRAALDGFLAEFAELHYDLEQLIVSGDRAAAEYRMSFRMASAQGRPVSIRGVFLFRVAADGHIAHRTDFWDGSEVDRQLRCRARLT